MQWKFNYLNFYQNPTLEHYTSYKASDLRTAVVALQNLQLNTSGCPLSAIRMKYRHEKVSKSIYASKEKLTLAHTRFRVLNSL